MSATLTLILIVVGAYLAAHVAFDWLARRFLIVSGAEYLILGILLGPQVSGLLSAEVVDAFAPFMTLALGWIGAVIGTQFYLPGLVGIRGAAYKVAFLEALLSMTVVAGPMAFALSRLFDLTLEQVLLPAITLGAAAAASAPSGVALIARRLTRRGPLVRQLEINTAVDAFVAITTFGLLLCFAHAAPQGISRPPTATEWAVITIGIGCVGGTLFHLFVGGERNIDRLFISLAGAIILASGAAGHLQLSPLLPSLLIGAILVNTSRNREEIKQALFTIERPLYFVLLIFAGANWRLPDSKAWLIAVPLFLITRSIAKVGSARLAARLSGMLPVLGADWGRALLGQGPLAIAIALNYLVHNNSLLPNIVFTATVASVLLTDLSSARLVQSVVRKQLRRVIPRSARETALSAPSPEEP